MTYLYPFPIIENKDIKKIKRVKDNYDRFTPVDLKGILMINDHKVITDGKYLKVYCQIRSSIKELFSCRDKISLMVVDGKKVYYLMNLTKKNWFNFKKASQIPDKEVRDLTYDDTNNYHMIKVHKNKYKCFECKNEGFPLYVANVNKFFMKNLEGGNITKVVPIPTKIEGIIRVDHLQIGVDLKNFNENDPNLNGNAQIISQPMIPYNKWMKKGNEYSLFIVYCEEIHWFINLKLEDMSEFDVDEMKKQDKYVRPKFSFLDKLLLKIGLKKTGRTLSEILETYRGCYQTGIPIKEPNGLRNHLFLRLGWGK